jgi:hypothetical protein
MLVRGNDIVLAVTDMEPGMERLVPISAVLANQGRV